MLTKTTFLFPDFEKNIPNKIHNNVEVKSRHILSIELAAKYHAAIATTGFYSKADGIYIFALKIDRLAGGNFMIGFTDVKNYDSAVNGYAGRNPEFAGTSLNCAIGQRHPGGVDYLPVNVVQDAQEIISVFIISNNGCKKEIQWIVDGIEGPLQQCHKAFGNGDEIFPCISFGSNSQQVEFIPFDQVKSRSLLIDELMKEYYSSSALSTTTNQGKAAVASYANNSNLQPSSAIIAQLQQELDKERQRANLLDAQLRQKDQQYGQVIQQKDAEIERLRQLLKPSPFVKDKLYQIDFAANGITPPADPNAFGTLLKLPSVASSPLFNEVRSMFRTAGSQIPVPSPVAGFELKEIEVINAAVASIELRMRRLQQLRSQSGNFFNPPTGAFSAEQLQTLIALRDQFLPRSSTADPKSPNLINVFHGTKVDCLQSVVHGLVAVRSTDAGFFGLGVYTTASIEYAAKFARGDFDDKNGPYPPRASDGCVPVVWCVAAVGVCYPVTPQEDYKNRKDGKSDFFGAGLKPGYDCHCAGVSQSADFQAVSRKDMQYMEIVFDQEVQVLPIAVLWVKSI